jgi:hypothetical protein
VIRANRRDGTAEPPITVKTYRANVRAHGVRIEGPSELVYAPNRPLPCGARLWLQTDSLVVAYDANGEALTEIG